MMLQRSDGNYQSGALGQQRFVISLQLARCRCSSRPLAVVSSDTRARPRSRAQDAAIAIRDAIEEEAAMHRLFQFVIVGALAGNSLASAADLTVDVAGLLNAKGTVMVAVFDSAGHFLKQPLRTAAVAAQPGQVQLLISDLAPGDYAVSLFQDENGNGKLDKNLVGMPVEPYGFSNDAAGSNGPPGFEQARVQVGAAGNTVTVSLR
jgi:uncharacterized protein (DUF2141 family)